MLKLHGKGLCVQTPSLLPLVFAISLSFSFSVFIVIVIVSTTTASSTYRFSLSLIIVRERFSLSFSVRIIIVNIVYKQYVYSAYRFSLCHVLSHENVFIFHSQDESFPFSFSKLIFIFTHLSFSFSMFRSRLLRFSIFVPLLRTRRAARGDAHPPGGPCGGD